MCFSPREEYAELRRRVSLDLAGALVLQMNAEWRKITWLGVQDASLLFPAAMNAQCGGVPVGVQLIILCSGTEGLRWHLIRSQCQLGLVCVAVVDASLCGPRCDVTLYAAAFTAVSPTPAANITIKDKVYSVYFMLYRSPPARTPEPHTRYRRIGKTRLGLGVRGTVYFTYHDGL